jgi:thiamine-monophosphate kinase
MLVEGTHFRRSWPAFSPEKLGWKSLAVNISDIAAMGGRPTFALISLALPGDTQTGFVEGLYDGLQKCAVQFGVTLAGGDTVGSQHGVIIDLLLLGEIERGSLLCRGGAREGEIVAVTGPLGISATGLQLLERNQPVTAETEKLIARFLGPVPRLAEGQTLAGTGLIGAMMDLSDGLGDDLPRLCQESHVGAKIFAEKIPLLPECAIACRQMALNPLDMALRGGEDYELLFTVAEADFKKAASVLERIGAAAPVVIGKIVSCEEGIKLILEDGSAADLPAGYQHFNTTEKR